MTEWYLNPCYFIFLPLGFASSHVNRPDDRKFNFFFANNTKLKLVSESDWKVANKLDEWMNYVLDTNQVFTAIKSKFYYYYHDRVWYFKTAKLALF